MTQWIIISQHRHVIQVEGMCFDTIFAIFYIFGVRYTYFYLIVWYLYVLINYKS